MSCNRKQTQSGGKNRGNAPYLSGVSSLLNAVGLSADLFKNRDEIVSFYGDRWLKIRKPWLEILHAVMKKDSTAILETSIKLAKMAQEESNSLEAQFILALAVEEIDTLLWSSVDFEKQVIRIERTRYFQPKSEESAAEVDLASELATLFQTYREKAKGEFVICIMVLVWGVFLIRFNQTARDFFDLRYDDSWDAQVLRWVVIAGFDLLIPAFFAMLGFYYTSFIHPIGWLIQAST